jgi:hypothetical protein
VLSSPPPISPLSDAPPLSPSPANAKQKQASNPALAVVSPVAAPVTIEKIIPTTPAPPPPQSNINYQNTNKPSAHQPIVQPQAPKYLQQQQQELIAPRPPKQQTVVNSELVAPRPPKQQQQQQHQYQLLPIQPPPVNVLVKQQQSQFPVRYNAEDENNATTLLETVRSQIEFDQPIAPASRFTIPPLEQIRFHVNELESNTAANYTLDRSQYLRLDGPDQKPMELGTGSYGHVVAAIHVPTGKMVAMKSIPKMKMIRREDRLRCELEIMSRVHHRNVLRLLDWGFGTYHIYLVMEM